MEATLKSRTQFAGRFLREKLLAAFQDYFDKSWATSRTKLPDILHIKYANI